jgi:hypothetical protein
MIVQIVLVDNVLVLLDMSFLLLPFEIVNIVMMLLTRTHYNVNLKSIDVDGTTLQLPAHVFQTGDKKGTIIDSGTTLAYLPELVFKSIMLAV